VGPLDEPALLQHPQIPAYRLGRDTQLGGELADVHRAFRAGHGENLMLTLVRLHDPHPPDPAPAVRKLPVTKF
jgi:hypothetical protein